MAEGTFHFPTVKYGHTRRATSNLSTGQCQYMRVATCRLSTGQPQFMRVAMGHLPAGHPQFTRMATVYSSTGQFQFVRIATCYFPPWKPQYMRVVTCQIPNGQSHYMKGNYLSCIHWEGSINECHSIFTSSLASLNISQWLHVIESLGPICFLLSFNIRRGQGCHGDLHRTGSSTMVCGTQNVFV